MLRFIGIILGISVIVGVVVSGSYLFDAYLTKPDEGTQAIAFSIEEGSSVDTIARRLEDEGLITSKLFFKAYIRFSKATPQAGEFQLTPGMSLRALVSELGFAQAREVQVTIPEGYTLLEIGEVVTTVLPGISTQQWEEVIKKNGKEAIAVDDILTGIPQGQGLEGYLFPDTYRFREDADAMIVAQTMVLTLKRRLAENDITIPRNLIFEGGLTFHEMLTLASIVEREVRSPEDMKIVAGIFYTRLKIGMALQADSTVNYVTGGNTPSISLDDSYIDSPYNTYRNLGLPPGPISNPGMNAILATLNHVDSDYVYFLTTPEGKVIYAKTFDEHVANKYQYLK